jgi:hypothetical protein
VGVNAGFRGLGENKLSFARAWVGFIEVELLVPSLCLSEINSPAVFCPDSVASCLPHQEGEEQGSAVNRNLLFSLHIKNNRLPLREKFIPRKGIDPGK